MKQKVIPILTMLLISQSSMAFTKTIKNQSVGCENDKYLEKLVSYARQKDTQAFTKALLKGISEGTCLMFEQGESVDVTEVGLTMNKVRQLGEIKEYWILRENL